MDVYVKRSIVLKEDNEHYSAVYECFSDEDSVLLSLTFKTDPAYRINLYTKKQVESLRNFLNMVELEINKATHGNTKKGI